MILLKFIYSFFLGGGIVALQSLVAEKYPNIGGYIISIPSTLAISLFFIGWISGYDAALNANQSVPFSLINVIIFSLIFALAYKNGHSLFMTNLISLFSWLVIAIVVYYLSSIWAYNFLLIGSSVVCMALNIFNPVLKEIDDSKVVSVISIGYIKRFFAAGTVILLASIASYYLSDYWAGIIAFFPAAYITIFNIISQSSGKQVLFRIISKIPESGLIFIIFSASFNYLHLDSILAIVLLSNIIAVVVFVLYLFLKGLYKKKKSHLY